MNIGRAAMFVVPAILVAVGLGMRFRDIQANSDKMSGDQSKRKNAPLRAETPVVGPTQMVQTLDLVGSVEAPLTVRLSPKVAGRILAVNVREGARVEANQALVQIDATEVEGAVLQQRAALAEAQARLAQAQLGLGATDTAIEAQIRQQQAGLTSANADLNQQRQSLSAQAAAADAQVTDAAAKVAIAQALVANAKADLNTAMATRDNAQARKKRSDSLFQQGFISAQEQENATTALAVAESVVAGAQTKIEGANSAQRSAEAQLASAKNQAGIIKSKAAADVTAAAARKSQAEAARDVARANNSQSGAYRQNLDALRATVEVAKAELAQAEARRADTTLRSPIAGIVTQRAADPGSIASAGTEVLVVSKLDTVLVAVPVPVEQAAVVKQGMLIPVSFDALPGKTFTGAVTEINPVADAATRQFTVRIRLANPSLELRPGMFARISLVTSETSASVYAPRESVRMVKGQSTVFTVGADGAVKAMPVELGAEDADGYEIKSGLTAGDKIVSLAYAAPKDGQKLGGAKPDEKGAKGGTGRAGGSN